MGAIDVNDLIDPDEGLVWGEVFTNADIYEQELKNIFARSWVFLAHETMIPKPGDFMQNYIGEDPVLVVRQKDGSVAAFLNQCRHRGMRLCRADRGSAKTFMCSFHGWNYDLSGRLMNVPHGKEIYDPATLEGVRAAKVRLANYKGFIFGTWDETAPDFIDYLGDFAWYFDAFIDRFEGGLEVVGVHKWVLPCNWKFNAEQPSSDMYHGEASHMSAIEVMMPRDEAGELTPMALEQIDRFSVPLGSQFASDYGHGAGWFDNGVMVFDQDIYDWRGATEKSVVERLGEKRNHMAGHANLFPNLMMLGNFTFRVTHPRGPTEMEIWSWSMAPVAAPDHVKEAMRKDLLRTFSPSGMFEQDDAINWEEEQVILRGYKARHEPLIYKQMLGKAQRDRDGYPGKTVPHVYAEEGARGMYRHYLDMMSGASWVEIVDRKNQRKRAELEAQGGANVA